MPAHRDVSLAIENLPKRVQASIRAKAQATCGLAELR